MIFTEPCCERMKQCLSWGEDRAFHLAGDTFGPLVVRIASSVFKSREGPQKQWYEFPVHFCPFCGRELQTPADVERYLSGGPA